MMAEPMEEEGAIAPDPGLDIIEGAFHLSNENVNQHVESILDDDEGHIIMSPALDNRAANPNPLDRAQCDLTVRQEGIHPPSTTPDNIPLHPAAPEPVLQGAAFEDPLALDAQPEDTHNWR